MNTTTSQERHIICAVRSMPAHREAVKRLLLDLVEPARQEAGCLYYDLYQNDAELQLQTPQADEYAALPVRDSSAVPVVTALYESVNGCARPKQPAGEGKVPRHSSGGVRGATVVPDQ